MRLRIGSALIAVVACAGLAAVAAVPAHSEGSLEIDGEYGTVVAEPPSPETHGLGLAERAADVLALAQDLMGDRYVDLWTTQEEDHLVALVAAGPQF
jgi:hypothetical protein